MTGIAIGIIAAWFIRIIAWIVRTWEETPPRPLNQDGHIPFMIIGGCIGYLIQGL